MAQVDGTAKADEKTKEALCEHCASGKSKQMSRTSVADYKRGSLMLMERICTEVAGSMKVTSLERSIYFIIFMDEYSVYSLLWFIDR